MFKSASSIAGFLAGVVLTVGLILTPSLIPVAGTYGYGYTLSAGQVILLLTGGLALLAATLWIAGKLIKGSDSWKQPRVLTAVFLIAFNANALFVTLVDFFTIPSGIRALLALFGVPVIYGNLASQLGNIPLKKAMLNIFKSAMATIGTGFIIGTAIKNLF